MRERSGGAGIGVRHRDGLIRDELGLHDDANARIGDLPGGFRTGKAAANHMDGISLGS